MSLTERYVTSAGAGTHDGTSSANAFSWTEMVTDINNNPNARNGFRYNVSKTGGNINLINTTNTFSNGGSITQPIIIRGYNNVIGDGYLGRSNNGIGPLYKDNLPIIVVSGSSQLNLASTGRFIVLDSVNLSGISNSTLMIKISENKLTRSFVSVNRAGGTTAAIFCNTRGVSFDNDIYVNGTVGVGILTNNQGYVINNKIWGINTAEGIQMGAGGGNAYGNIIHGVSAGINLAGAAENHVYNNTITNCVYGLGSSTSSGSSNNWNIINNIITNNGYGIYSTGRFSLFLAYNYICNNQIDINVPIENDWYQATQYGSLSGASAFPIFSNSGSDDYTLTNSSPAKNAGSFGRDIGAFQSRNTPKLLGNGGYIN